MAADFNQVLRESVFNRNLLLKLDDFNEDELVQILAAAQQATSITSVVIRGEKLVYTELSTQTAHALGEALLALPVTEISFETLKFEDFGPVAQAIRQLKYRKIGLEFDQVYYSSGRLEEHLQSLLRTNTLEFLMIGEALEEGRGVDLSGALHSNRSVKRLGYTSSIQVRALPTILRENTFIKELDLRCTYLCLTMFLGICRALVDSRVALTKLTLSGADDAYVEEDGAEADALANTEAAVVSVLAKYIPSLQHLGLLHGRWNIIGLCDVLTTCKLESLHLIWCDIGDEECQSLAGFLETNETLKQVDFSRNMIGNDGASALGRALTRNITIEDITVANNWIGPEGASAITGALSSNSSVKKIDISFNRIESAGATSVFQMLTMNDTIEFVGLDLNGSRAFYALIACLPHMTTVKELHAWGLPLFIADPLFDGLANVFVRFRQKIFVRALEQNTVLVDLNLPQPPQPVEDILTRNRITLPLRRRDRADTVLERWGRDANSLLHILGESPQDADVLYFALHELLDKVFHRIGERDVASPSSESRDDVGDAGF